jgi:hypothetical protein
VTVDKLSANVSTTLNPFGPNWSGASRAGEAPAVGSQVQQALFGAAKPPVLDPARFPQLAEQLKLLARFKKKLAVMAGDAEEDYDIQLADGTIAMIDERGTIFVGAGFLAAFGEKPEVLVGVLAHEIGHRPKRWNEYRTKRQLSREELEMLCRHEETRADIFAGKALAEMGLDCEPIVAFLKSVQDKPHPEYFPAEVRADVIRDAHAGRRYRAKARRSMFPEFDRMTSPKGHLGEY